MTEQLNFQSTTVDRLPPQNIEAEEAILGGIMLDPEAIARVCDRLIPEAFYISSHKDIYQAALRLHTQSRPTDLLSVTSWLTKHKYNVKNFVTSSLNNSKNFFFGLVLGLALVALVLYLS
ncbi:DnaB-like helicase N-terminal domain-containing protein [Nostoc sp.]|uniref:DnaB-like helicase N-terminal domain-containing protein n=1 Tax=Nostoc sp. TaxID=1180 RepID=UPI002FF59274